MRELKFRIWDKDNNCFFKSTYEAYKGRLEDLSIDMSGELTMRTYDNPAIHESVFPNRFEIQQYTGLKGKNGKEIYEGDIVEFTVFDHNDVDTQYKGVVKFRSGLYEIWNNNESEFYETDGAFILNFVWLQDEEFKVIGNIFENPELLQGVGL